MVNPITSSNRPLRPVSQLAAQIASYDGSGIILPAVPPPPFVTGFPFRPGQDGGGGSGQQAADASGSGAGRQPASGIHVAA